MPRFYRTIRLACALALASALAAPSASAGAAVTAFAGAAGPPAATRAEGQAQVILANHRDRDRDDDRARSSSRRDLCRAYPDRCRNLRDRDGRDWNGRDRDRRTWNRHDRDSRTWNRRDLERRVDRDRPRYKRGHRGYPYQRHGYRRSDDGWWYPLAAFALAAIIANQADSHGDDHYDRGSGWSHIPAGSMRAHDNWCDARYRSYSRTSKTFQPYQGPRRYCNSPYDLL